MSAVLIDGNAVADGIVSGLKADVEKLTAAGKGPQLVAVQVGENPASRVYIRNQRESCEKIGISYRLDELPAETNQEQLGEHLRKLNADSAVSGVILQMPLPEGVDAREAQLELAFNKDVEGMHPANMGRVVYGDSSLAPCTAQGAFLLAKSLEFAPSYDPLPDFAKKMVAAGKTTPSLYGKNVVIVGHSEIVGKPLALLFLDQFCTVEVCHIATRHLAERASNADILCVAVGKAGLITAAMIKPGAAVIDIGINRVPDIGPDGEPRLNKKGKPRKKTVGDVDFEKVKEVAGFITPVPGGVGPMTVAMLLKNTVAAAKAAAAG
jgi:methylenetetrahydrofolate dehydrogenase (NADP+) / methenyltetrahydrofolate cyclohydrolase